MLRKEDNQKNEEKVPKYVTSPLSIKSYPIIEKACIEDLEKLRRSNSDPKKSLFNRSILAQLNSSYKRMLVLGMGAGEDTLPLLNEGWKLTGYDMSASMVSHIQTNFTEVEMRAVDLSSITTIKGEKTLSYEKLLRDDLSEPTNVFALNIVHLLDNAALCLLIFKLMELAKPGTVFYFINPAEYKNYQACRDNFHLPVSHMLSFFAARTDMWVNSHEVKTLPKPFVNDVISIEKVDEELAAKKPRPPGY